jgi:hypothetical protein
MGASRRRRMACYKHMMVRASIYGWFVCQSCGLPAGCPGCVERLPGNVAVHCCREHIGMGEVSGRVVVWATGESSR